jgi:hypothetical protein
MLSTVVLSEVEIFIASFLARPNGFIRADVAHIIACAYGIILCSTRSSDIWPL